MGKKHLIENIIRLKGTRILTGPPVLNCFLCRFNNGLPVELQIAGHFFDEAIIVNARYILE